MAIRLVLTREGGPEPQAHVVFEFDQTRVVIGRGPSADVRIPHRTVSENHAVVRVERGGYVLVDEGSTNGTMVGDTAVVAGRPKPLRNGDVIRIGGFALELSTGVAAQSPSSAEHTAALAKRIIRELLEPGGPSSAPPRLVILEGPQQGESLELPPPPVRLSIGRAAECDLVLRDAEVSREQVEILRDVDGVIVRDLGAKNPLLINEKPAREKRLRDRDELCIGSTRLVYEDPAEAVVRSLEGQSDLLAPPPEPPPPPSPAPNPASLPSAPTSAITVEADAATRAARRDRRERQREQGPRWDLWIYALAALVLAVSALAIVALLRAE